MTRSFFLILGALGLVAGGIVWIILSGEEEAVPTLRLKPSSPEQVKIEELRARLETMENRDAEVQRLLLDSRWKDYRSFKSFRRLFRDFAPEGRLQMTREDEPGTPILIRGRVRDESGAPVPRALVYAFQVDAKGVYHDAVDFAENAARLFGYVRTDKEGRFEIRTIRPANFAYAPKTSARVTIRVRAQGYESVERFYRPSLYFADDPALDAEEFSDIEAERGVIVGPETGDRDEPIFVANWEYVIRRRAIDEDAPEDN
jgi:Dioxygenase